jgi:hypothetical protein
MSGICERFDFYFSILSFQKMGGFCTSKVFALYLGFSSYHQTRRTKAGFDVAGNLSRKNAKGDALAWKRGM